MATGAVTGLCAVLCCGVPWPQGRTVSFKNTLVLLTSNIGSRVIAAGTGGGLAVFGSRRQMLGADEDADETLQVRKGWGLFTTGSTAHTTQAFLVACSGGNSWCFTMAHVGWGCSGDDVA